MLVVKWLRRTFFSAAQDERAGKSCSVRRLLRDAIRRAPRRPNQANCTNGTMT